MMEAANGYRSLGAFEVETAKPHDPYETLRRDIGHIARHAPSFVNHIKRMRDVALQALKTGDPAALSRVQGRVAVLEEILAILESQDK